MLLTCAAMFSPLDRGESDEASRGAPSLSNAHDVTLIIV